MPFRGLLFLFCIFSFDKFIFYKNVCTPFDTDFKISTTNQWHKLGVHMYSPRTLITDTGRGWLVDWLPVCQCSLQYVWCLGISVSVAGLS